MALQIINLGTYANDGTGDDLRTAFLKVNANLTELYSTVYGANIGAVPPTSGVEQGELWWNTEEGKLYVYYNTTWVEASPSFVVKYDISASGTTGGANLDLNGTDLSLTSVKFASSTNITVERTSSNTITFSSTSYTGNVTGNLVGDTSGTHTGPVFGNVTGDVTGNTYGTHYGNITGNAETVTNGVYTTSSINALADVNTVATPPTNGQALAWDGSNWVPQTIVAGVSRVVAGNNISISPLSGLGEVTINSTGVSDVFDFGQFQQTFNDPISYLLDQVGVDFGTFTSPATFTIDGGTF